MQHITSLEQPSVQQHNTSILDQTVTPRATARAHKPRYDDDNARLFAEMHRDRVLYDHTFNKWRIWDGRRWVLDQREQIMEYARQTALHIRQHVTDGAYDREASHNATAVMNLHGLRNMLICARSLPELAVTAEQLDRDPLLFNVQNGTIDLRTGLLREARPSNRITLVAGCAYDQAATAPRFLECLRHYWPDTDGADAGIATFLLTYFGYCLSGLNTEKLFVVLHGTGDTGKTTLVKALEGCWGDYFKAADWSTFAQQRDGSVGRHRTDLVRLAGARVVSASEGDEGCRMSEGIIKRVTGRTPLVVRDLMSKPFEFVPGFKLMLDTNHLPHFNGNDRAMWNRIVCVPFRRVISHDEQIAFRKEHGELDTILREEASGILNLALAGWNTYRDAGRIDVPARIQQASSEYRRMEDTLGQFLEECCVMDTNERVEKGALFACFSQWAQMREERPISMKRLGMAMLERGIAEERTSLKRYWSGLSLRTSRIEHPALEHAALEHAALEHAALEHDPDTSIE